MKRASRLAVTGSILGLAFAVGMAGMPAWADPPGGFKHDNGHDRDEGHGRGHDEGRDRDEHAGYGFRHEDRIAVYNYFTEYQRGGGCPPGLAKKHDGCMPPGQAKKWRVGERLPPEVVYYPLPPALVVQLTPPPVGYQYVRVASDILMIAAGTGMVASAIEDLGR